MQKYAFVFRNFLEIKLSLRIQKQFVKYTRKQVFSKQSIHRLSENRHKIFEKSLGSFVNYS